MYLTISPVVLRPLHFAALCLLLLVTPALAAEPEPAGGEGTPAVAVPPTAPTATSTNDLALMAELRAVQERADEAQRVLRSYLQLQEQLQSAVLAIERGRQEANATAARNAQNVTDRLTLIEQGLTDQRRQELAAVQSSNRLVLTMASVFAALGFLAVVAASWLQLRALNRMAEISATFPGAQAMAQRRAVGILGPGESAVVSGPEALPENEQPAERLRQLLQSLETRVRELEQTAHVEQATDKGTHPNGETRTVTAGAHEGAAALPEKVDRVSVILGKGQALLNLNQVENALACFDDVLAVDPNNTEALIKKGTALERLRRLEEAIECYDRAIAANDTMTLAYLYKGGVFNQMERFNEALECYEQALRSQQKT
jgi:tetratricopeptide (TPR) repeat protein